MKIFMHHAMMTLIVAAVCQTGLAQDMGFRWVSDQSETASAADVPKAGTAAQSPCDVGDSAGAERGSSECGCENCLRAATQPCRTWYVDYRVQRMFDSNTSFQFGSSSPLIGPYTPISKLTYSLDSTWTGLRLGVQKPNWDVHFEWLTPMGQTIDKGIVDYDWNISDPKNDPTRLDSLAQLSTRWNDGQKLELEGERKWSDRFLGLPIELWPLAGFRFQRFDMTADRGYQIIGDGKEVSLPGPFSDQGDCLTLNQQYYIGYVGAQFRAAIQRTYRPPIAVTFQADYGGTGAYNIDYHLQRGGDMHQMMSTGGGSLHLALIADAPFNNHCSIGLQADHAEIRTTGTLRQVQNGIWITSDYGVQANSDQTSLAAYFRFCR
jgi:hypothetical protein